MSMSMSDLRKYFNKRKPSGAICFLIFGILFFLLGISIDGGFMWANIGVAMGACGISIIVKYNKTQSDSSVDSFCHNVAKDYYAFQKSTVESYGNTIDDELYSDGYIFDNIFRARLARRGNDNIWRSSIYEMKCIFFAAENVYYYSKKVSLITDEKYEKQKKFRVCDIQMVSLEELNQFMGVAIAIPGNEKIYINCKSRESAIALCDKIKSKLCKGE